MVDDLTIINDVSDTLKNLLESNVPELSSNLVTFGSPADTKQTNSAGLSLFLYQISENPYLKNQQPGMISPDKLKFQPLALDLFYLLTPFAQTKQLEQIILSKVMRTLYDNAILSGSILKGSLNTAENKELRIVFHPLSVEELNKLWNMFPNTPYRISISYIITPVIIPSTHILETKRVITKETSYIVHEKTL